MGCPRREARPWDGVHRTDASFQDSRRCCHNAPPVRAWCRTAGVARSQHFRWRQSNDPWDTGGGGRDRSGGRRLDRGPARREARGGPDAGGAGHRRKAGREQGEGHDGRGDAGAGRGGGGVIPARRSGTSWRASTSGPSTTTSPRSSRPATPSTSRPAACMASEGIPARRTRRASSPSYCIRRTPRTSSSPKRTRSRDEG
jgi:hypothetical protein